MTSELGEFHDELRTIARQVVGRGAAWRQVVDAGLLALEIPESLGGAGASFVETAIVLEEMGRAAAQTPCLGTVLAVGALTACAAHPIRDELLERIGAGATAAFATGFTMSGDTVSGCAEFVPDASGADVLLLQADVGGTPVVVLAERLSVTPQPVLDETRALATVTADSADVYETCSLTTDVGALRDRAAVAIACDSLGVAEAMLAATVEYASVRQQFDRAIGSFQAVKHACADMLVQLSVARELVAAAAEALATGDSKTTAAMAKSYTCAAAVDVVGKAMQLHGGIGYTWESGLHVYLKRAMLNRSLYGSPASHRRQLAARYR